MLKRIWSFLMVFCILAFSSISFADDFQSGITVIVDGKEIAFENPPFIEDDRVLVPMRAIFEALGANVDYDDFNKAVICRKQDTHIIIPIDEKTIFVNQTPIDIDTYARIIYDRTFVPLRAISECLGANVDWDENSNTVTITSPLLAYKINDNYIKNGKTADDGTLILELVVSYPQIENINNSKEIEAINTIFSNDAKNKADEIYTMFTPIANEDYEDSKNSDRNFNYYCFENYFDITYLDENTLSIKYENYYSTNGVHPNTEYILSTYNLKTGEKYKLTDILNMDSEEINQKLVNLFTEEINNNKDYYFDDAIDLLKTEIPNVNFYLDNSGITFYFNEYVITPHSTGVSSVKLNYVDNEILFKIKSK